MASGKVPDKLLRLFISYSRRNEREMQAIRAALEAAAFEVTIDTNDLQSGDAWRPQLLELIRDADTIVFLITDASIASEICQWELDQCVRLSKRIMPVSIEARSREMPPQLGAIQLLPATGLFALERDLPALVAALTTDRSWLRESTQYAERARQWAEAESTHKRRAGSFLLSGSALARAEAWKSNRSATAPEVSREIQDFLHASRKRAGQRQRSAIIGAVGAFAVAGALASTAYVQHQTRIAERDAGLVTQSNRLADAAYQEIRSGDSATGLLLALEGLPTGESGDVRKFVKATENILLSGLLNLRERDVVDIRGGAVISGDGTRLAYGTEHEKIRIVDVKSKALVSEFAYDGLPTSLNFSFDGKRLVTLSTGGKIHVWDVSSGRALLAITNDNRFGSVVFSPDGSKLLFANGAGRGRSVADQGGAPNHGVMIFDIATLRRTALLTHPAKVFRAVMSEDGRIIATAGEDRKVRVFDAIAGRLLHELPAQPKGILDIALSRDGSHVISGSEDGAARLWRTDTGALVHKFVLQADGWLWSVGVAADGRHVLTSTGDELAAWSIETGRQSWSVKTHVKELPVPATDTEAAFALDQSGATLATAHIDNSLRIWSLHPLEAQVVDTGCGKAPRLHAARNASVIATFCKESGAVQIWDGATRRQVSALGGLIGQSDDIALAPDGATLAVSTEADGLRLIEPRSGRSILTEARKGQGARISFSPGSANFAIGLDDGSIRLWKRASGTWAAEAHIIQAGSKAIACMAFSPGGDRLLSVAVNGASQVWNAQTGAEIAPLLLPEYQADREDFTSSVFCGYGPDGRTLAIDLFGHLQIWDAQTFKILSHTQQGFGPAVALDYSPDGQRLVRAGGSTESLRVIEVPSGRYLPSNSGSGIGLLVIDGESDVIAMTADRAVKLVDRQTQRNLKTIDADPDDLRLSVSGGRLVGAMQDGKLQIWPIPAGGRELIQAARRATPRCLTFLQRINAGLSPTPPRWCITGADQVSEADPFQWKGKWPYHGPEWKQWLAARDRGENPDPPDLHEYSQRVETRAENKN